ncbi:uncharacterized protein LOC131619583 [Vicia villosa]|uniref:uncharacterized protein LOC131619583 n=1 Tax=Vicia villosa TaxID=3911 RepID=UPI00273AB56B|nr:uncharacterized protein LOC131619583 [Vicia villosa]
MIIGSLNVRGCGNALKRRRITDIIKKGNADMFFIQESKLSNTEEFVVKSLWSNSEIGFSFSNSEGLSGGIISLWRTDRVEVIYSFRGEGFLGNKVVWKEGVYYVVNVYSSCNLEKKKVLWRNLLDLKRRLCDGDWIIGGDFNATKSSSERKGRRNYEGDIGSDLFGGFIGESGLVDVPCKGKRFSWFSGDGRAMSRIDRFLISNSIVNKWGVVGQLIGKRDISDHSPVWLVMDDVNWGPKPFKFNNEWFSLYSFLPFVEKEWNDMVVEGRGDFVLKEKLRRLKDRLVWWNKNVFGRFDLEVEDSVRELNLGDEVLEFASEELFGEANLKRRGANKRFWLNLRIKENMLVQKSRLKWLNEGCHTLNLSYP